MKELSRHILSRKTVRGAAIAVASFSVLTSPLTSADEAGASDGQGAFSVDSASDTLAAILKDAQEKGFVRVKSDEVKEVDSTEKKEVPSKAPINPALTKQESEPLSCESLEALNFSDLEDSRGYDSLTIAKEKYAGKAAPGDAVNLARAYIALGLGDEALETLHAETSADGQLLKQAAKIIAYPESHPQVRVISDHKNCSQIATLWSFLEAPTQFPEPFDMMEIRNITYSFDDFPPVLKERVMVTLAIVAAESDQKMFADYILERLENKALEDGRPLPQDRTSDLNYLYLSALFQKNSDPDAAIAKFNFLAERGSVYRANSVKYIAEIKSREGKALGDTLEADLEDVSERLKETTGTQGAAYQLVSGQLKQDRINDSIHSVKSFLEEGTEEYKFAQDKISTRLLAHFQSESQAVQSTALDTFLRQRDFLKEAPAWEDLKSGAFTTSLALGLPELVTAIQMDGETINKDQQQSLKKARILLALKAGTFTGRDYLEASAGVLAGLEDKVVDYALMRSDQSLAKLAIEGVADKTKKSTYELNLAWLEQDWSRAQTLSGRQKKNGAAEKVAKPSADNTDLPKFQNDPSILAVLAKPALAVPSLKGTKWRKNLSADLSGLEDQIKISKAFLKNG